MSVVTFLKLEMVLNVLEAPNHYLLPQVTTLQITKNFDQDLQRLILLPVHVAVFIADRLSNGHVCTGRHYGSQQNGWQLCGVFHPKNRRDCFQILYAGTRSMISKRESQTHVLMG